MEAVVLGNVTLDILCYEVEEVPRYDSLPFDCAVISPGGCGSNVAIGLAALGISIALVAKVAAGETHSLIVPHWIRAGVDTRYVTILENADPAVSVGLIDGQGQPRFVHTPGTNSLLTTHDLQPSAWAEQGVRILHIAGFFALPGLLDGQLPHVLAQARSLGMKVSLDVINSPRLDTPDLLWSCLPQLDYFFCNLREGQRLTRQEEATSVAAEIRRRGAEGVIVKLGEKGCWLDNAQWQGLIPTEPREPVDTTGAGDAFAAGFIAAVLGGADEKTACLSGHETAARIVSCRGAVAGWFQRGA